MPKDVSVPGSAAYVQVADDHPPSDNSYGFGSIIPPLGPPVQTPSQSPAHLSRIPPSSQATDRQPIDAQEAKNDQAYCSEQDNFEDWCDSNDEMPSDLRPPYRANDSQSGNQPLLKNKIAGYGSPPRLVISRRSTFRERDLELEARRATKKRYAYAAAFLLLSLVSFVVQTETAVYIQHELKWNKAYCMLYFTHGSWFLLWPVQLLILRVKAWNQPWSTFWRRHVQNLRQTAQMIEHNTLRPAGRAVTISPVLYMLKTTAFITCALTIAGGSWYVAVDYTTASDLTAIYNCSAFFAYVFSVPLLHERVRLSKIVAVLVAILGVLVLAYGESTPAKHGDQSGRGAGGNTAMSSSHEAQNRIFGNLVIGLGSVLYGLYEVLYKKLACPPDGCSPGRSMIFANAFGSAIGCFTLVVLWVPLPILHYTGWEKFELPYGKAGWLMAISVLANATFSGSFLVLISLTSPVLSSVAALLTVFIVTLLDELLPPPLHSDLTFVALVGGVLIIIAFTMLGYASYKEIEEEKYRKIPNDIEESNQDD
ncbi:hypothetical protein EJ05DRAFT_475628 [Pseudovirgaria hyperparasitica]|uniref:EamA domain-containing protein n=1 Tax=Pseudovirgaria hyperparasitica TaxID=470096 RepID=A0A6A6W8S0_9PEZI|nr:uncharacterized protein EJ05DRAFT_475628 [Pseudovirgaria hyperparasitica]KAF2758296.1 hypothetical protein EJ05DRAFT_475628 [Pseudovirgaria hyperparasitica]